MARKPKLKIFLLAAIDDAKNTKGISPWRAPWDVTTHMVVQAESAEQAREVANQNAGDENISANVKPWLNEKYTTCVELSAGIDPQLIVKQTKTFNQFSIKNQ